MVPTTFRALVTRRPRYSCQKCEAALVVQVLVSKYPTICPYTGGRRLTREGVEIDVRRWPTISGGPHGGRDHLLDALKRSGKLFADETVTPMLDSGPSCTERGQLWVYERDDRP